MEILGIDIGGTGMKGALINLETGELISDRFKIPTPTSRKPEEMVEVFKAIVKHFNYTGSIGCGFPTIVKQGICKSTSNLHKSWMNLNAEALFSNATKLPVTVVNDADAAGYAIMNYGIGKNESGLVIIITIGTGIGSGVFFNGQLIPNFELGQIPYKKYSKIEHWTAASIKNKENLSYSKWGKRFNTFLGLVETIASPDLIILGGGTSKDFKKFEKQIKIKTPVKPAFLGNHAGLIGAASAVLANKKF